MRSGFLFIVFVMSLWVHPVHAGAWLREKGTTFTSFSYTTNWFRDTESKTYLEYGVRDDLTLGAELSFFTVRDGTQSGYGMIFLRRPLGPNEGENKWAYELGVGAAWTDDAVLPYLKTGVSWGRGIKLYEKYGWVAVDASMAWDVSTGHHLGKLDGTVGLNFTDVTSGMLQLYLGHLDSEIYGSIAPSLLIKPRNSKFRFQIGTESQLGNLENTALKLGLWREF